jgi:DNA-binding transcriptional LysR family regulator
MQWDERIGRRVRLRDLHIVLAVTQAGSMGKAAARLGVSQPVVSKALAGLEHTLGVRLFDRNQDGVEPTMYGRALLQCGTAVFDELRRGVKGIEFLADPAAGELRIGTTNSQASGIVSAVIERLSRRHPRITFHVAEAGPDALRGMLDERAVELVLGAVEAIDDADVNAEILFHERFVVLAGKRSPWARRSRIALSELVDEYWILGPESEGANSAKVFRASGLSAPRVTVSSFSMSLRNSLLATGRYLTMLPGSMFLFGAKHLPLKVLPVKAPEAPLWPIRMVTLKNRTLSPVAQLFIECARDIAGTIDERFKNLPALGGSVAKSAFKQSKR